MISKTIRELLETVGITVNGPQVWDIQVHDQRWYRRVLVDKNLGLGESYMAGWWDCERIDEMMCRLLTGGLENKVKGNWRYILRCLPGYLFNLQSGDRGRVVASRHYDLGNDLFFSFLDSNHQYSCGYFQDATALEEAQIKKLDLIAGKLELSKGDHLLDIGCGWGGLAKYMAEHRGSRVTGVNISREQLRYAREYCQGFPVDFLDCDYRRITDRYDKAVSVGMFEHVGQKNYRTFMKTVHRCLKDDGIFLLHTIGNNISRASCDPWFTRYIFPNSMLPSLQQISRAAEELFVIEDVHNFGPYYDQTLMAWNQRFQQAWPSLQDKYDGQFKRMWEYYLLSCAGSFRARNIQLWQIVMTKQGCGTAQPACRR